MTKSRSNCRRNRNTVTVRVDRLVAEAFVDNDDPINKTEVYHIDGDRLNNHANNLKWVTKEDMDFYEIEYDFRDFIKRNKINISRKYLPENRYYCIFEDYTVYDLRRRCFAPLINNQFKVNLGDKTESFDIIETVRKLFYGDINMDIVNDVD